MERNEGWNWSVAIARRLIFCSWQETRGILFMKNTARIFKPFNSTNWKLEIFKKEKSHESNMYKIYNNSSSTTKRTIVLENLEKEKKNSQFFTTIILTISPPYSISLISTSRIIDHDEKSSFEMRIPLFNNPPSPPLPRLRNNRESTESLPPPSQGGGKNLRKKRFGAARPSHGAVYFLIKPTGEIQTRVLHAPLMENDTSE